MKTELPIACSLTEKELQERRKDVLQKTAKSLVGFHELENGFNFQFPVEDDVFENLMTIINLERKCCPFLNFKLVLESQNPLISLELTGQKGTKEIIQTLFEWA